MVVALVYKQLSGDHRAELLDVLVEKAVNPRGTTPSASPRRRRRIKAEITTVSATEYTGGWCEMGHAHYLIPRITGTATKAPFPKISEV